MYTKCSPTLEAGTKFLNGQYLVFWKDLHKIFQSKYCFCFRHLSFLYAFIVFSMVYCWDTFFPFFALIRIWAKKFHEKFHTTLSIPMFLKLGSIWFAKKKYAVNLFCLPLWLLLSHGFCGFLCLSFFKPASSVNKSNSHISLFLIETQLNIPR